MSSFLSYIDSPTKAYILVFGFQIYFYSLSIITAIFLSIFLLQRVTYRYLDRKTQSIVKKYFNFNSNLYILLVVFGILGGRLYSVATEFSYYKEHLNQILYLRSGGMAIYGAVLADLITLIIWCRVKNFTRDDFYKILDFIAPSLALSQAIGRIGNYFNNELYGFPTKLPWKLKVYAFQDGAAIKDIANHPIVVGYVQPLFLYEGIINIVICIILILAFRIYNFKAGIIWFFYLAFYGFARACLENLRDTEAIILFNTRINTIISLIILYYALYKIIRLRTLS